MGFALSIPEALFPPSRGPSPIPGAASHHPLQCPLHPMSLPSIPRICPPSPRAASSIVGICTPIPMRCPLHPGKVGVCLSILIFIPGFGDTNKMGYWAGERGCKGRSSVLSRVGHLGRARGHGMGSLHALSLCSWAPTRRPCPAHISVPRWSGTPWQCPRPQQHSRDTHNHEKDIAFCSLPPPFPLGSIPSHVRGSGFHLHEQRIMRKMMGWC